MSANDPNTLTDEELFALVVKTDGELFNHGLDVQQRSLELPRLLMQRWGFPEVVIFGPGTPKLLERIRSAFRTFYRPQDLIGGGHIGVYMYRDVFARVSVPQVFGSVTLHPFEHVDLTPAQCLAIQSDPRELGLIIDQFTDVIDVQYGVSSLEPQFRAQELVVRFIGLARLHLHASAAILTGAFDFRGAVQSALLATELALKAGAAAQGLDEAAIKKQFGHNLKALIALLHAAWPRFDAERVRRVIATQPPYVENRYSAVQPARRAAGHTTMGAQYVVSEVVRQLSNTDVRRGIEPLPARVYPP